MYSPLIIDQTLHALRKQGIKVPTTPYGESLERATLLEPVWDPDKGQLRRELTDAEIKWIAGETMRCSVDFRYCATRYFRIKGETPGELPLWDHPWESQEIILAKMAALQETERERRDGILLATLKARQEGASTVYELVMTHKAIFTPGFTATLAADVPEQSEYLFNMMERAYEHLPWWLKPHREYHVKGSQMWFDQLDSLVVVNHGNKPSGDIGKGKSQPLDARVLTPAGWRFMGDIKVGDEVIGANGAPTKVLGVFPQGLEEVVRVTFSDGSSTECSLDHLWEVTTPTRSHRGRASLIKPVRDFRWSIGRKWRIPLVQPVVRTCSLALPLDPYVLGILLGDGCFRRSTPLVSSADEEILEYISNHLPEGHVLHHNGKYDWRITYDRHKRNKVTDMLREWGLFGRLSQEKWVPPAYLEAAPEDRLSLLQGLIDSDGYVNAEGRVIFTSASQRLSNDVATLVWSLGGCVRQSIKQVKGGLPAHVVVVQMPHGLVPVRLKRKLARYKERMKYPPIRYVVSVEAAGQKETQCIAIEDPRQLYVTDNYILTHNTSHATHLSELETWHDTVQIQDGLLPAIPRKAGIMVFFESTGQYNVSWWHDFFMAVLNKTGGIAGIDRFEPVFVPWYAEPTKYSRPAPADWQPDAIAAKHAAACEAESPKWCGKRVTLSRDQLYWWQTTRNSAATAPDPHALGFFFCNYCATPEEAFRSVNTSVFSYELMEALRAGTSHPKVWEVDGPHIDLGEIRNMQRAAVGARKTT